MLVTCLLSVGLALVSAAAPDDASASRPQARTLLLVQPLYPGQEAVAQRAEQAIGALLPQEMKAGQIVGREALAAWVDGRRVRTGCLLDKPECREPLDAWMRELELESVVLVKGGQDGSGFRFRTVRVRRGGERLEGEATDTHFEKALTGALVKVYSLAATVEVVSTPPGATVFVDGVKVGTTPLSMQMLPGEHTFRFELASYDPAEVSQTVRALAPMKVEHVLHEVRARLVVQAETSGSRILVDGQEVGRDRVDIQLAPGPHVLRLEREGYESYETSVTLAPGERFNLQRPLEPSPKPAQQSLAIVQVDPPKTQEQAISQPPPSVPAPVAAPAAPAPKEETRDNYFEVMAMGVGLNNLPLVAKSLSTPSGSPSMSAMSLAEPQLPAMQGFSFDMGSRKQYYGWLALGASLSRPETPWEMVMHIPEEWQANPPAELQELQQAGPARFHTSLISVRLLQPQVHFTLWRFSLFLQVGFEGKILLLEGASDTLRRAFPDGLVGLDVHVNERVGLRADLFGGVYATVAMQLSQSLRRQISDSAEIRGGLGYAF